MWFKYGLKAQKLLAQGIALGMMAISISLCGIPFWNTDLGGFFYWEPVIPPTMLEPKLLNADF